MPDELKRWVEGTLGSPVVRYADQVGGFSPGCASRLVCADGKRAFVKAVGAGMNPDTPTLFRREVQALTLLGSHDLWADLLAVYDTGHAGGHWVGLLLEDVEGSHPDLHDDETMARLVREPADVLVHGDIRNDNLLQRPDGTVVFLDWGAAALGPDWLDPLLARLERVDSPRFDASLSDSPPLARAGDDTVTSWLVGMGVYLAHRAHTSEVVGLPTLGDFRRRESARYLAAAERRLA